MNKPEFFITNGISNATGKAQAQLGVRFDEEDEFGLIHRKQGFMPCTTDPAKQAKLLEAANSGKVQFTLGQADRRNPGLYQLIPVGAAAVAEPAAEGSEIEHK